MIKSEKNIIKIKQKEKKVKDPKEYIHPHLLHNLREYTLINNESKQNTEEIDENKNKNYSSNYRPEFIPCTIPEEWKYISEEEINSEIFTEDNEFFHNENPNNNIQKNNNNDDNNMNTKEEINTDIIHKLNNIIKLEDDSDMFLDPDEQTIKDNLPLYLVDIMSNEIKWKRPYKYILQYYLWEKVKLLYPKKKQSVICNEIIEKYKDYLRRLINGEITQESEDEKNVDDYLSNETETIKKRIFKEFYPILDKEYNIKVCDYISRLETDKEYKIRKELELKEMNDKKGKNLNFKNNKINLNDYENNTDKKIIKILKISNLKLNMNSNNSNSFYTWMTSIFQFIIDNDISDINTKKSILYNIYPQKDGIPIFNPKGKYIIKLYLMGKERKIIIDDKIPFTNDDEFIFPGCDSVEEIWPILFTKALLKLNIYKHRHPYYYTQEEFTDISIIYNLTGRVVILYDLNDDRVFDFLSNEFNESICEYKNDYIFGFFKSTKTKSMKITKLYKSYEERIQELNNRIINKEKSKHLIPVMQSIHSWAKNKTNKNTKVKFKEESNLDNSIKNRKFKLDSNSERKRRSYKRFGTIMVKDNKTIFNIKVQEEKLIQEGLIKNYLYTLNDFFLSKNFNLKRTKKLNFDDLKKESENSKLEFKQLDVNQKKLYIAKRKEIKLRHKEERLQRINELKEFQENEYILYKLNSNCVNLPSAFNSFDLYNDVEISLARKCLANKWKYPPKEFFSFDELPQIDSKLLLSIKGQTNEKVIEYKRNRMNILCYGWTLSNYKELAGDDYIEVANLENDKIINTRDCSKKEGYWFSQDIIQKDFDQVVIVFNGEELYNNVLICDNSYSDYLTDVYVPKEEYQAFYLTSKNNENYINNPNINSDINNVSENYNIDIIFEPYIEQLYKQVQPKVYLMPYINIDIYECETQNKIFSKITLNKFYSFFHSNVFESSKNYYILIANGYYPMGYNLTLISNGFKIENMTSNKIFQQILKYKTQEIDIDFPSLEKNKIWLFGKILIKNNNTLNKSNIKFKLNINFSIKKIFPFIHVYLENEDINSKRREIMLNEFVTLYQDEKENQIKNYITITIKPEYELKNGIIHIEILYDNDDFTFDLLDTSQPYEITGDPVETNNNGLIFSEYIYPSENEIVSFINVDIINKEDNDIIKECDYKLELYQLTEEPNVNHKLNSIHFSYSNVATLLKCETFYNSITLSNIIFYSRKPPKNEEEINDNNIKSTNNKNNYILPYVLICYVNDRINNNFKFDKIKWNIRIFSDNILSFVKDTSKTDHENKIKEGWKNSPEGRKILAAESRKKFKIISKKLKGIKLTKGESELLLKPRIRHLLNEGEEQKENIKSLKGTLTKIKTNSINPQRIKENTIQDIIGKNKELTTTDELKLDMLPIIEYRNILHTSRFKMSNIINFDKKLEKSSSSFILNYVNYFKKNRTIKQDRVKESSILTKTKYKLFNEKIIEEYEKSERLIKKADYFVKSKEHYKNDIDQHKFKKFVKKFEKIRISASNSMRNLINKRNIVNQNLSERIKYEKKVRDIISGVLNLEIDEMSSISHRAKEILPESFKGLNELDLIIKRKQDEEDKSINKKIKK